MDYTLTWTYNDATCAANGEITNRDGQTHTISVTFTNLTISGAWPNGGTIVKACEQMPTTAVSTYIDPTLGFTYLDISDLDTSGVTNMSGMFGGSVASDVGDCTTQINKIDGLNNIDTSSVTDMSNMFLNCRCLNNIDLSNWNTSKVTDMSNMFCGCSALTTLDLSNWNTSKVTDMSNMFDSCYALNNLNVLNWDTSSVTDMLDMFYHCNSLNTLDLSSWDTSSVEDMSGLFHSCSSMVSLDLSNFDMSSVKYASYMFMDCDRLTVKYLHVTNKLTDYDRLIGMGTVYIYGDEDRVQTICSDFPGHALPVPYPVINSYSFERNEDNLTQVDFSLEVTTTFNLKNGLGDISIRNASNVLEEYTATISEPVIVDDTKKYTITGSLTDSLSGAQTETYLVYAEDTLGRTTDTVSSVVPTNATVISLKGNSGIAFGDTCTDDGFTCHFDAKFKGDIQWYDPAKENMKSWLDHIYPVGAIYMSTVETDPSNLFGGTWEQIKDTFLLASGSTYTAGATGGEATHTLTTAEMPSHTHAFTYVAFGGDSGTLHYEVGGAISGSGQKYAYLDGSATNRYPSGTKSTGSGNAHNNMPPYLAVYVWKRIQ